MSNITQLQDVIRFLHGVESRHIRSVPIKETFEGQTVWEGVVEEFELIEHATAKRLYAWSHETDDPVNPIRHVTVLHGGKIASALDAVRAAIIQEFRSGTPAEEA